jgi:quercetin dioxygenase-like cupin family protein
MTLRAAVLGVVLAGLAGGCAPGPSVTDPRSSVPAAAASPEGGGAVAEKLLLDNDRLLLYEFVFPPGFRGEEHAAIADELAYVLDGEFTVLTRGAPPRVIKRGEVIYAPKGVVHLSLNATGAPARVLVVMLKER